MRDIWLLRLRAKPFVLPVAKAQARYGISEADRDGVARPRAKPGRSPYRERGRRTSSVHFGRYCLVHCC